jgi:lipoprotein-anchoring transpeptidase ErfK/SrfK
LARIVKFATERLIISLAILSRRTLVQTIKTAAIVVLLMSVVYGAWVSLTTPPESLPPDVADMIVMDQSGQFPLESALPPSLGDLEINSGTLSTDLGGPSDVAFSDAGMATDQIGITMPGSPSESAGMNDPLSAFATTPAQSLASANSPANGNVPVIQIASADPGFSTTLTDREPTTASIADSADFTASQTAAAVDAATGYRTTGRTFQMPDPTKLGIGQPATGAATERASQSSTGAVRMSDDSVAQVSAVGSDSGFDLGGNTGTNVGLANAIRTADAQYSKDQLKEALSTLSIFYDTPNLSGEQRSDLLSRLDPLAAEVIYSRKHLLERPHRVTADETLVKIAERYEVPWQLLANINQVRDPIAILPGTELKVVRGPFRAEVDLAHRELTLFLGDLYAGRFPIGVGNDPAPKPGTFSVLDKQTSKVFYDAAGSALPPGSPDNPYGGAWIDLGGNLCIHGSSNTTSPNSSGCISLAADYADDLYGILSHGSTVTIK